MAIGDIIVGMDIGTSKVSIVIGEVNNFNQIEVIYTDSQKCRGIKKGKIIVIYHCISSGKVTPLVLTRKLQSLFLRDVGGFTLGLLFLPSSFSLPFPLFLFFLIFLF